MSSGDKLAKGKSKKAAPKAKTAKGKEVPVNDHRFRGEGVKFKCKLVGSTDVSSARGDAMCADAIKKLKVHAMKLNKENGEHKQKIVLNVTLKGIRITDEKTLKVQYDHPINKISFITHDPEDKKVFGYVCSQPCSTGHKLFAIKTEKSAGVVTGILFELFQVVFQLRQQAGLTKKAPNSAQVSNGPSPQVSDGIYEVPYKNGNNKNVAASPEDQQYAEPVTPTTKNDPHYKVPVPNKQPVQPALPPLPGENNKDPEVGEKTTQACASNSSSLLSPSSIDKDPDQVSQASVEVSATTPDISSSDMAFFSPSVFESAPGESGAADTVSVASADISVIRSGSVSSGSSESHSQDTKSVHSRSSSLLNQTAATEGLQAEFATTFDDDNNVAGSSFSGKVRQEDEQASESGNQGDLSTAFPPQSDANMEDVFNAPPVSEASTGFESKSDPFAPSDISSSVDKRTDPGTEDSFFTTSFAAFDAPFSDLQAKDDEKSRRKDECANDPFASSIDAQAKSNAFESAEGFASKTSFETTFGSEQFSPAKDSTTQEKSQNEDEKSVEAEGLHQSVENSATSFTWDNAFGETKAATQPETTQSVASSEGKFSWTESFTSEDVELSAAVPKASAPVSWDDAFGGAAATDQESSSQGPDAFSWNDAFGGMTGDGNNSQFDSSVFGDAFAPISTVESCDEMPSVSKHGVQQVSQSTLSSNPLNDTPIPREKPQSTDNPQVFDDNAFIPPSSSHFEERTADAQSTEVPSDPPALPKDPFEELTMGFAVPPSASGKTDLEETKESSESDVHNVNEDIQLAKEVSSELPSGEHTRETKAKGMDEMVTHAEEQSPISNDLNERGTEQNPDEVPSEPVIQYSKPTSSERPISPTVPPPLPPRPVAAAPPLPARPSSSTSTISTGMSPVSPQTSTGSPSSNSPREAKKGSAKKPPPALPPRIDLNENSANVSSNATVAFPDPFGEDVFDKKFDNSDSVAEGGNSDWVASWPNSQTVSSVEKTKVLSDPFSEDFFTNFDFPQKPASDTSKSNNLDPFAGTNPPPELFPSAFGNQDLFAAFTPAKGDGVFSSGDPFKNDLSNSFTAFPSDDPFSDISDPFADKGVLNDDPFGDSPRKPQSGKALNLNESLVASDEADSFA